MTKQVLSQAEKRAIYVREGWINGYNLAKLMAWHDVQIGAEKPDGYLWHKLFRATDFGLRQQIQKDMAEHRPGGIVLDDIARSCSPESDQAGRFLNILDQPIRWFAFRLAWDCVKAIPIASCRLALVSVIPPFENCVLHLDDEDKTVDFAELSASDLFDAALESWSAGIEERDQARRWLHEQMWSAIMVLHDQAGVAFDTSVAVSDDGMRVLAADYVVVYAQKGKDLEFRSFQGVAFLLHKIRLGQPHVIRRPVPKRQTAEEKIVRSVLKPREVKKIVQETRQLKRTQALLQIGKLRILFIEADQIPAELQPAVASTAPAPASSPTQPSPGAERSSPEVIDPTCSADDSSTR